MTKSVKLVFTSLLALGIAADGALMAWEYRHGTAEAQLSYTLFNKSWDEYETSHSAIAALQDAVVQVQGYAMTGEAAYSDAYTKDVDEWQDSFGTLELLARKNKLGTGPVADLSKTAGKVLDTLALAAAARNKGPAESALDVLRKGSAGYYVGQAKEIVGKMSEAGVSPAFQAREVMEWALQVPKRMAQGAAAMFIMMLVWVGLLIIGNRKPTTGS